MEQVSSFLENILTIESGNPSAIQDIEIAPEANSEIPAKIKSNASKQNINNKRMSDIDFSSFWYKPGDGKKANNSLMADKLMEKVISMMVPMNITTDQQGKILNDRIEMQKTRPPLSIPIMSKNSIQLNQRLSSVFLLQDNVIKFFNWENPFRTIGVLLIISHVIANPYLITAFPFAFIIFQVLIPHYLIIYPPDNSILNDYIEYNPIPSEIPLDNYKIPKPVPQFTREFILNLTDLQNHMVIFITAYDFYYWLTSDYFYFKDEALSSSILLLFFSGMVLNLLVFPKLFPFLISILPIKSILLILVWCITILSHPHLRTTILDWVYKEETRLRFLNIGNKIELYLSKIFDKEPEIEPLPMQVEIFELQRYNRRYKTWDLIGFTNNIFSINSPYRNMDLIIDGEIEEDEDRIRDCFKISKKVLIDNIKPPKNWEFVDKQWTLDLMVHSWVKRNLIEDLVYIDEDEKWVYDYQQDKRHDIFRRRRWIRDCVRQNFKQNLPVNVE